MIDPADLPQLNAQGLIELLDQAYPHECIRPDEDIIAAHRRAAKRELVDELINLLSQARDATEE
ncbi:hypothetical protein SAMN02983003_0630 [Devosia enhydra]|uniref:Uncharacterized protein n=1 Tax=Devosia enhydra TaxID=665118 RepID=A0A1K2HUE5_9HYPH|nr:hypothetical protein [Devosia enhydra]SFZ81679.1 hypothetical protein SAMN02983003_0630 [Devosia enhydra]